MTWLSDPVHRVASELLPQAALLTRLIIRQMDGTLSRTEAGLLNTLGDGSRRITELAELEGLAQPTTTLLVKRLGDQGWVAREREPDDGRVVLVRRTAAGDAALAAFRRRAGEIVEACLDQMPPAQIEVLAGSVDALQALIVLLQREAGR
jgi:DNA-binding MarR family transcriptional regulator